MIEVERPADLAQYIGKEIGVSDWFTVDQAIIDKFAEATGDHQWIHVDVERAKREMPGGKTIAHGYLTLSLVPRLAATLYRVNKRSRGLNYGSNRVRFTGQVPAGSRIRLHQRSNRSSRSKAAACASPRKARWRSKVPRARPSSPKPSACSSSDARQPGQNASQDRQLFVIPAMEYEIRHSGARAQPRARNLWTQNVEKLARSVFMGSGPFPVGTSRNDNS